MQSSHPEHLYQFKHKIRANTEKTKASDMHTTICSMTRAIETAHTIQKNLEYATSRIEQDNISAELYINFNAQTNEWQHQMTNWQGKVSWRWGKTMVTIPCLLCPIEHVYEVVSKNGLEIQIFSSPWRWKRIAQISKMRVPSNHTFFLYRCLNNNWKPFEISCHRTNINTLDALLTHLFFHKRNNPHSTVLRFLWCWDFLDSCWEHHLHILSEILFDAFNATNISIYTLCIVIKNWYFRIKDKPLHSVDSVSLVVSSQSVICCSKMNR